VPGTMTASSTADEFPPHVLREYALIADGERGAIIGPRGEIVWMCAPRWHSDAIFASLIGGGGAYAVTPDSRFVWGGYYEPGTLIWHSRWITCDAVVECREAARWFERSRAACGPAGLYSEEYDVAQRQMRGNPPQAFVHALMLECSARLAGPAGAPGMDESRREAGVPGQPSQPGQ
jgi:Domain of unknown function (DUF5911)